MDIEKIAYWIFTALLCGLFCFSAGMYFTNYEMVTGFFEALGFPTWLVYPLATVKILGVIAILSKQSKVLKEWAYAGFLFDLILATAAHHFAGHGLIGLSSLGILLWAGSYFMDRRVFGGL